MRPRLGLVATAAATALAIGLSGGCAAGHNVLGTEADPCFRALPAATAAQHHHGQLVGVRSVSAETADRILKGVLGKNAVCLVAFRDNYTASDVDHLVPGSPTAGRYAVVAVGMRSRQPIGTVLTDELPLRFHHTR